MNNRVIPSTPAVGNKGNLLWMEDEDLIFSVKKWMTKMGKSKYSSQYESISSINILSGVTSYSLAQFVGKHLAHHLFLSSQT